MGGSAQESRYAGKSGQFSGAKVSSLEGVPRPVNRIRDAAFTLLLLMAVVAFFALRRDVTHYITSIESIRDLQLSVVGLEVVDDGNPRARIRFNVKNGSQMEIGLESYLFKLYLSGKTIGSSHSMYRGTGPGADPGIYLKAQTIDRILGPGQTLDLAFTLFIYSARMDIVRRIRSAGPARWQVRADVTAVMPGSRRKFQVKLRSEYEE